MATHPFPVDPVLTGITLAYKNKYYIADEVLPRVPVSGTKFSYRLFDKDAYLTVPDTRVGRKSKPNQVELSYTEVPSETLDYGLEDTVPNSDIEAASKNWDPIQKSVEFITELMLLAREKRVVDLVFNENTYASGLRTTLSGTSQFSHESSNPVKTIKTAIDSLIMHPNVMVMGGEVFSCLSSHPKILKAVYPSGSSDSGGIVTAGQIANLFNVERVLVGNAWINAARPGATASICRAWGKHIALLHINAAAGVKDMPTFGVTAEYGDRASGTIPKPEIGAKGSELVRVTEQLRELVIAPDFGFFIKDAVA